MERADRYLRFVADLVRNRWFILVVSMWIQAVSGASYNFSLYSGELKDGMGYDQQTLDTLGWFKDLGESVGIISGVLYDRFPPWGVLVIGAAQNLYGYTMLWMTMTGQVEQPPLWQMCCYICIAANGQTYLHTTAVVTCVKNFPMNRGIMVGMMKGFSGLSSAILTQLWLAIYGQEQSSFLLMVSWLSTVLPVAVMFVVRPVETQKEEPDEIKNLLLISAIALSLSVFLMAVIMVEDSVSVGTTWNSLIVFVILLMLLLPVGVAIKSQYKETTLSYSSLKTPLLPDRLRRNEDEVLNPKHRSSSFSSNLKPLQADPSSNPHIPENVFYESEARSSSPANPDINQTKLLDPDELAPPSKPRPQRGEDFSLLEAISGGDFWLLMLASSLGIGSGLTAIDNLSQVGTSLGYSQSRVHTFVSLVSIWNFLGRVGSGLLSELALQKRGIPRPAFLVLCLAMLAAGYLVLAGAFSGSLYLGSISIGLSYGGIWALIPACTSELFGLRSFGTLLNLVSISNPMSAYLLSVQIAGCLYDIQATKQANLNGTPLTARMHKRLFSRVPRLFATDASDQIDCTGPLCFRLTFTIMAAVCLVGALAATVLYNRTKKFYRFHLHQRYVNPAAATFSQPPRHIKVEEV